MKTTGVGHLHMPVHVFVADAGAAYLQWAKNYCDSPNETSKQTLAVTLRTHHLTKNLLLTLFSPP